MTPRLNPFAAAPKEMKAWLDAQGWSDALKEQIAAAFLAVTTTGRVDENSSH